MLTHTPHCTAHCNSGRREYHCPIPFPPPFPSYPTSAMYHTILTSTYLPVYVPQIIETYDHYFSAVGALHYKVTARTHTHTAHTLQCKYTEHTLHLQYTVLHIHCEWHTTLHCIMCVITLHVCALSVTGERCLVTGDICAALRTQ